MQTRLPSQALRLLWAFDFDGVVCHSAKELCITGWSAARAFWPEQTAAWPERPGPPLIDSFYRVRPVVETGWEVMLINRALQEGRYDTGTILRDYTASLREQLLREYGGHTPEDYMKVFRDVRSEWMTRDEAGWLGENDFYPGALDCLRYLLTTESTTKEATAPPVYVITTKGKEFTLKLLEGAGLKGLLPEAHVFGLGSGKKVDVLKGLIQQHEAEKDRGDVRAVFIEDRLQTLLGVLDHHDPYVRERSDLLLAGWGYNTAEERKAAENHARIRHLPTEADFLSYIKGRQGGGGGASSS